MTELTPEELQSSRAETMKGLTGGKPSAENSDETATEEAAEDEEFDLGRIRAETERELTADEDDAPDEDEGEDEVEETESEEPEPEFEAEAEDEEEGVEETPPAPEDPAATLRAEITQLREQIAALTQRPVQPPAPPPERAPTPEDMFAGLPDEVARMALHGASAERWQEVPEPQRVKALDAARRYWEREVRYARDPALRYREVVQPLVVEESFRLIQPLIDDYHARKGQGLIDKHLGNVTDKALRERASELYLSLPQGRTWEERDKLLGAAVKAAKAERAEAASKDKRQRRVAGKAQAEASGNKTLKAIPKARGRKPSAKELPEMADGETVVEFYRRVRDQLE